MKTNRKANNMTKNIFQKLKQASEDARFVKKTEKKGGMNFNPLEHDAVQSVAMECLNKNGLYPYCTYKDFIIKEMFVQTTCKMTIVDIDAPTSFIEIETHAIAKTDKYGSGNCMSYARKYAFLNALNLKTGMKDEAEEGKDSEDGFIAKPLYGSKPVATKTKTNVVDELQIIRLNLDGKLKTNSVLRGDMASLKTRINQDGVWDAFTKTDVYTKLKDLELKINQQNRRS